MIRWDEGDFPAKIWGFLDLSALPVGFNEPLSVGRNDQTFEKGIYAIVETADYEDDPTSGITSDIFSEILLETTKIGVDGMVVDRKYYLADVKNFVRPMVVVPNLGGMPNCKYFEMTPKAEWPQQFADWLEMNHAYDSLEMAPTTDPDSSSADEIQSSGSETS